MKHCDAFEKYLKKIKFNKIVAEDVDTFDGFTKFILNTYFEGTGIGLKLGSHRIWSADDLHSIIFKTDDDYITYLDIFPSSKQFMFISDKNHNDSMHPDQAMIYLLSKRHPGQYSCMIGDHGSVVTMQHGDVTVEVCDTRRKKV
jgi:hypothetical protein